MISVWWFANKVTYHIDNGENVDDVLDRFQIIFDYLKLHKMLNGEGLRVVLWLAGCSHHCHACQNPITWDANDGLVFDDAAKKEIFDELEKDWCSGITFSGGAPLYLDNREIFFNNS